jgi:PAS domain S-box-containing protein
MFRDVFWAGTMLSRTVAWASILVGSLLLADCLVWSNALCHTDMNPNTALGFIFAGAALFLLLKRDGSARWRYLGIVVSTLILLLAALTLFEILRVFGITLGPPGNVSPFHMSPNSALNFVLVGASLGFLLRGAIMASQGFAVALATSSYLSLLGSWYGGASFYQFQRSTPIAVISALTFLIIAIGLLWARPSDGLMGLLNQNTYGGEFARKLIPSAILLPPVISWIRVEMQHRGLYRTETDIAVLTVARTVVLIVGIILMAREFTRREAVGHQITGALQDRELRWSTLFDQIGDGVVTLDENGNIETINRRIEQLFRYSAQDLRGLPICRLLASHCWEDIDERLASGESIGLEKFSGIGREVEGVRKDGSLFPMELCINQFWLHERRLFSGVMRDITERHTAQQMTDHFAAIVEGTGDAIIGETLNGTVTSWNRGAEKIFGYSSKEMIGESIFRLIPPDRPDDMQEILNRIRRGERIEHYQTERLAKDGRSLVVSLTVSPLFGEDHRVVGASKIARDITEQTRLEEQLRQSQRMEAVGQLAGSIAHDFNNLLTVINGYADLTLRDIDPSDPMHSPLQQILASGERGAALTQHLLAFSRKQILLRVVLDLNTVLTGMEALLRRLVKESIQFQMLLDTSALCITADPRQIEQVVMNLVINAKDAMPLGGSLMVESKAFFQTGIQRFTFWTFPRTGSGSRWTRA